MPHKELTNKEDFDAALATKDKYVLIFAYSGEIPAGAEAKAEEHSANTDAFKVDVDKYEKAKDYFKITTPPTVLVYKDGEEIKRIDGMTKDNAGDISAVLV